MADLQPQKRKSVNLLLLSFSKLSIPRTAGNVLSVRGFFVSGHRSPQFHRSFPARIHCKRETSGADPPPPFPEIKGKERYRPMNPNQFRYQPRPFGASCRLNIPASAPVRDLRPDIRRDPGADDVLSEDRVCDSLRNDDTGCGCVHHDPCCPEPVLPDPGVPVPAGLPRMPAIMPIAAAYVPMQELETVYSPEEALTRGTLFPALDLPFRGTTIGGCCHV